MSKRAVRRRRSRTRAPLEAELRLEKWGPRGSAYANVEGHGVLVDRGIPGEEVVVRVGPYGRPWRGVVERVIHESPERVAPPCPYFVLGCGGCQWQHLDYAAQLGAKRSLLDLELERFEIQHPVDACFPMTDPWRYRHTASLAIGWEAGFRPRGRRGIIEIHDCQISHPLIGSLSDQLNRALRAGRLPNYHGKVWLDTAVVGTTAEPRLQVVIQGIEGLTLETHPELPQAAGVIAELDGVESVSFRHRSGHAEPLVGDLMSRIEVNGRLMYLAAGAFFQTNLRMLALVLERMRNILTPLRPRRLADVYGGVGTFGLQLADLIQSVVLIELDRQAIEAARLTAAEWDLPNVEFVTGRAERSLPDLTELDAAIVDPPRSGLEAAVIETLCAERPPTVIYLSCSPSSLARDLAAFQAGGYTVQSLEIFDFYPQTYHVESLAVLER